MKKFIYFLIIILFISSCDSSKKRNQLVVNLDVVIPKNDSIQVFYRTDNSVAFTEKQSFWNTVKGNPKNQTIQIVFPKSIKPKQIRIDLGRNVKNKEIVLNKIGIFYSNSHFEAKGDAIYKLFRIDPTSSTLDKMSGTLKRKNLDQINGSSLYPNGNNLFNKLNKIYTKE